MYEIRVRNTKNHKFDLSRPPKVKCYAAVGLYPYTNSICVHYVYVFTPYVDIRCTGLPFSNMASN